MKRQKITHSEDENAADDLLLRLPDSLLCSIVSRLPIRDAAALDTLSKEWRNRSPWRSSLTLDLNLDLTHLEGGHDYVYWNNNDRRPLIQEHYVGWVNHLIKSHVGETIESFRVSTILPRKYSRDIHRWIRFAMRRRAHTLVLDLNKYHHAQVGTHEKYQFPPPQDLRCSANFLRHLTLRGVLLDGMDFSWLASLESLRLEYTCVSQKQADDILSECSNLRSLVILRCQGPKILNIQVPPNHPLKHLDVSRYRNFMERRPYPHRPDEVQIGGPGAGNIERLECMTHSVKGHILRNLPKLKRLSLVTSSRSDGADSIKYAMTIQHNVLNLETLDMTICSDFLLTRELTIRSCSPDQPALPNFHNLKRLSLRDWQVKEYVTPELIMLLLRMCPMLHTLELQIHSTTGMPPNYYSSFGKRGHNQTIDRAHPNLKVVKIVGFIYCQKIFDILVALLENATNLDVMLINQDSIVSEGLGQWNREAREVSGDISQRTKKWLAEHVAFKARVEFV